MRSLGVRAIEDYALIGDRQTAALVSRSGCIDWLCLPRFDSPACFAALLGDEHNGHWSLRPAGEARATHRAYRHGTLVLDTEYETDEGAVRVTDCMPERAQHPRVLRIVEGQRGQVTMDLELLLRFDYGSLVPWVRRTHDGLLAIAGPDAVSFHSEVPLGNENLRTQARFTVAKGERRSFVLAWHGAFAHEPIEHTDAPALVRSTTAWWQRWSARARCPGAYHDAVVRSLITLKALTYAPTGAIVAAPTTSLPEVWGGTRNWDYRYCWLRDATFTLYAMINGGYTEEAVAWRDWLLRAIAGSADQIQAMYGVYGERRVEEVALPWLSGYGGAKPVRLGNAVHEQLQLDIFGELADVFFLSERSSLKGHSEIWPLHTHLVEFLEHAWHQPDSGMWELRGTTRDYTHSKVMTWVAFDRSVKMLQTMGFEGPLERWRTIRDQIHEDVCRKGFDAQKKAFVQYYGAREVDASALLIPQVGFLPIADPRVASTVRAIETDLLVDGFVRRYRPKTEDDGLGEACFLPCSCWLADVYVLAGRHREAEAIFNRVLSVANDVGLLAEEYDPRAHRLMGNFPQAFSHVALVNTAHNLTDSAGPARHRPGVVPR